MDKLQDPLHLHLQGAIASRKIVVHKTENQHFAGF
jgi:hypothetical protein